MSDAKTQAGLLLIGSSGKVGSLVNRIPMLVQVLFIKLNKK